MPDPAGRRLVVLAAMAVAVLTAGIYRATMLPGLDLGDTPSFQTMGGSTFISPRDAYPLYFAFGAPFVWVTGDPALGMNLASVVAAALACGGIVLLARELSGSLGASLASALTFAGAFTFWSQAVTTEVYTLHVLCLVASLTALLAWERQPTDRRLIGFFLVYALSFGNHLTMVLLLPGVVLLLAAAPGGGRRLLTWRHAAIAAACVTAGAAPYLWNLRTMFLDPVPPESVIEGARRFWFDVTKVDWRDTMVLQVPESMAGERWQMYRFDLRQQFGWLSLVLAGVGALVMARYTPRRLLLLILSYAAFATFALTYSVGDTHVFLLPGHLIVALAIAPGLAWLSRQLTSIAGHWRAVVASAPAVVVLVLGAARIYQEFPALDRSHDRRARQSFDTFAGDLRDTEAIVVAETDWQWMNGLNYYAHRTRRDLASLPLPEVLPYVPTLVADNEAIGRHIFVTAQAARRLKEAYGPLFRTVEDPRLGRATLSQQVARIPGGSRYVLCVLKPNPGQAIDADELSAALTHLAGGGAIPLPRADYVVVAGVSGRAPQFVESADRPFRVDLALDGVAVAVRFDAWLTFDTIRRMGFGQVIAGRHHALIVERGISLVTLDGAGRAEQTVYADGLYAPLERLRLTFADGHP